MSELENNKEDIRANRLRITELDTAVMNETGKQMPCYS